ncbi:MAG: hypothetical protein WAX77_05250 [Methylococcaceae bacterium]
MSLDLLKTQLDLLEKQLFWLDYSYSQINNVDLTQELSIESINHYENLCSRFARTIDFLIRKVFRTIDACEFEHQGTLIDVVNNAHKRKLFTSMDLIRNIKDLRNEIVHEYIEEDLIALFAEAKTLTAELIIIVQNTLVYGNNLLNTTGG